MRRTSHGDKDLLLVKKKEVAYVCNDCGADYRKWQGQCADCG
ncbi:MAG: hypothetical protein ACSLE5_11920, partial [Porticoccaceae bacterium]